ncbi:MAG: hypothetical protein AB1744_14105, partial [Candidatus Zixiibacteriota bacterium]
MKKLVASMLAVMALLVLSFVPAQAEFNVKAGIKAGPNATTLYGNDAEGLDSKLGFCGGGFLTVIGTNGIAVQNEVLYVMRGSKEQSPGGEEKL